MRDVSRSERQVGMGKKKINSVWVIPNQYPFLQLPHIWPSNPLPTRARADVHFITMFIVFIGGDRV